MCSRPLQVKREATGPGHIGYSLEDFLPGRANKRPSPSIARKSLGSQMLIRARPWGVILTRLPASAPLGALHIPVLGSRIGTGYGSSNGATTEDTVQVISLSREPVLRSCGSTPPERSSLQVSGISRLRDPPHGPFGELGPRGDHRLKSRISPKLPWPLSVPLVSGSLPAQTRTPG